MSKGPIVAVTMGDPAGIGPEVVVKALAAPRWQPDVSVLVVGDARVVREAAQRAGVARPVRTVSSPAHVDVSGRSIDVLDLANAEPGEISPGVVSAAAGRTAMEAIERAVSLALRGEVAAIATAPIHKEATRLAGWADVGHLEYLARITGATEYATMLVSGRLRVVHLTTHFPLRKACELVSGDRILGRLRLTHRSFERFGVERPRIGVAALNPHAGDGGLFGREEIDEIVPAVAAARVEGIDAQGPFPADSIFTRAIAGAFDVVLAMYHDQGHIPIKVHGLEESVSVALGLPLVRTSVDHGTAFDIAGKYVADHRSMALAIDVAARIVAGRWLTG